MQVLTLLPAAAYRSASLLMPKPGRRTPALITHVSANSPDNADWDYCRTCIEGPVFSVERLVL